MYYSQDLSLTRHAVVTKFHCVKGVRIRSFSGPHFPAFGLNTDICRVNIHIQSECGKIRTKKTPNMEPFCRVFIAFKTIHVVKLLYVFKSFNFHGNKFLVR